jgi:hypothetical protein
LNNEKRGGAIIEGRETFGAFNTRDHNDKKVDLDFPSKFLFR